MLGFVKYYRHYWVLFPTIIICESDYIIDGVRWGQWTINLSWLRWARFWYVNTGVVEE